VNNWDNIRFFLALARARSLAGAARSLGVNHSTVLRRLAALEDSMGVRLFSREGNDRSLTEAGTEMMPLAEKIEATIQELDREVTGRDTQLSGTVRLTTTDSLAASLLPALIAAFREEYQDIQIVLIVDNAVVRLSEDADVSLRPARSPEADLVGRRVCDIAAAIYCGPDYLQSRDLPQSAGDLWSHDWIIPDDSLTKYPVMIWTRQHIPPEQVVSTSTSILTMAAAVRSGLGLAVLPCFMADTDRQLVRLSVPIDEISSTLWLLSHRDLKDCARFRAFRDFAFAYLSKHRDIIEGRAPSAPHPSGLISAKVWGTTAD
jgi:DNA-binding transcriptional LysR family regulator